MNRNTEELLRLRLTEQITSSVENSLRRRYVWIGVISISIVSGLGTVLVDRALDHALDTVMEAKIRQELAYEQFVETSSLINRVKNDLINDAKDIQDRLQEEEQRIAALSEEIEALKENADIAAATTEAVVERTSREAERNLALTEKLRLEVERVNKLVKATIEETEQPLDVLLSEADEIASELAEHEGDLRVARAIADRGRFQVLLIEATNKNSKLRDVLEKEGFTLIPFRTFESAEQHDGILLDPSLPVKDAALIVKLARQSMPGLKYVIDSDSEVFPLRFNPPIGVSVIGLYFTEEERDRLIPLTDAEFRSIFEATDESWSTFREKLSKLRS